MKCLSHVVVSSFEISIFIAVEDVFSQNKESLTGYISFLPKSFIESA